jgi:molybdopterin-guanine dinucleotide biosynthesis protein A
MSHDPSLPPDVDDQLLDIEKRAEERIVQIDKEGHEDARFLAYKKPILTALSAYYEDCERRGSNALARELFNLLRAIDGRA